MTRQRLKIPIPNYWRAKVATPTKVRTIHFVAEDEAQAKSLVTAWCGRQSEKHSILGPVMRDRTRRLEMFELLLGPALEEDRVGHVIVNPKLALKALDRLIEGHYDRHQQEDVWAILPDAVGRTLRAIFKWQSQTQQITTPQGFVSWLTHQPWNVELFAVPNVQDWIDRIRRSHDRDLRRRLGRWLERVGAASGGPLPRFDAEHLNVLVGRTTYELEQLWETLRESLHKEKKRATAVRDERLDELSPDERQAKAMTAAWKAATTAPRCRRIVRRLERANFLDERRRDQWTRRWPFKALACELVATENNVGASYLKKLARDKRT